MTTPLDRMTDAFLAMEKERDSLELQVAELIGASERLIRWMKDHNCESPADREPGWEHPIDAWKRAKAKAKAKRLP